MYCVPTGWGHASRSLRNWKPEGLAAAFKVNSQKTGGAALLGLNAATRLPLASGPLGLMRSKRSINRDAFNVPPITDFKRLGVLSHIAVGISEI
jgi:hypothetical protein